MSGSSLDGLDIAMCSFSLSDTGIGWSIDKAETLPFSEKWVARLLGLPRSSAIDFYKTHTYFGHYMAELVNLFIEKNKIEPDFISSHGHTIYHYPDKMMTCQIGDGAALASKTGYPVICDFRTSDIALQGEGTPLAPAADRFLFHGYDYYLNLGGIANISFSSPQWMAYDVIPCNQILNFLSQEKGLAYDKDGMLAKSGKIISELLEELNADEYLRLPAPKSLDNVSLLTKYIPIIQKYQAAPTEDRLRTITEWIAQGILDCIEGMNNSLFITGGGAYNSFLIKRIRELGKDKVKIELPDNMLIEYKEALLMALLGVLRIENQVNCFNTITGASRSTIGGAIYQGTHKFI